MNTPKTQSGGSLKPVGWAAMEKYVARKLSDARRSWDSYSRPAGPTGRELCSYWEGQYVALHKLKMRMKLCNKAKPNDQDHR